MIGGIVLAAVAVVVVLVAISSGGSSGETGKQTGTQAKQTVASVNESAQRHPPGWRDARQPEGARDDDLLR